jgi:hypothetical protein
MDHGWLRSTVDPGPWHSGGSPKLYRPGDTARRWSPRGVGERERGRSDGVRGAFTGEGEAAKSAGSEEVLWHPLELDAATFRAWRREAIGGDGRSLEWWCSRGLYIGRSQGGEAVQQGKRPVLVGCFTSPISRRGDQEAGE